MKSVHTIKMALKWTARITGSAIFAFLLFFLLAHAFGDAEQGEGFRNTAEFITFLFFPVGVVIGLLLALKWELLGGIITVVSLLALFIMRVDLVSNVLIMLPIFPGLFYIIYGLMNRKADIP